MAEKLALYKLSKRIMKEKICVGYIIEKSNGECTPANIAQTVELTKRGLIFNLGVRILENGTPILYGLNGFSIKDLPENTIPRDIKVVEAYMNNGELVGVALNDGKKTVKVKVEEYKKFIQNKRVEGVDSIKDTYTLGIKTTELKDRNARKNNDELYNIYSKHIKNVNEQINTYNKIISVIGGDDADLINIEERMNQVKILIDSGKIDSANLISYIDKLKALIRHVYIKKEAELKVKKLKSMMGELSAINSKISKLLGVYGAELGKDVQLITLSLQELRGVKDIKEFVIRCNKIVEMESTLNKKLDNLLIEQADDLKKLEARKRFIQEERGKVEKDILEEYRIKLIEKPWYIRYKSLLNTNKYLENIICVSSKGERLSLMDISIYERKEEFELRYNSINYAFKGKMTNFNLICGTLLIADRIGVGYENATIKFRDNSGKAIEIVI